MRSILSCVVLGALSIPIQAQFAARRAGVELQRVARTVVTPGDGRALLDRDGRELGRLRLEGDGVRATFAGSELVLPRLQEWEASPDGRTLVGAGDAGAYEHPFELEVRVWREGEPAATLPGRFDPESEFTVGADGTLALVGQRAGARGAPLALLLAPDGTLTEHALPAGTTAHDPRLVADGLLLRSAPLPGSEAPAALLRVDALGVRALYEAPGLLALVPLTLGDGVLLHEREGLLLVDAHTGAVRWRQERALRPASERAWHAWDSPHGALLALVTCEPKRRADAVAPAPRLELLELATGAALASLPLEPGGPPGSIRLRSAGAQLTVAGRELEEVFQW